MILGSEIGDNGYPGKISEGNVMMWYGGNVKIQKLSGRWNARTEYERKWNEKFLIVLFLEHFA